MNLEKMIKENELLEDGILGLLVDVATKKKGADLDPMEMLPLIEMEEEIYRDLEYYLKSKFNIQ